MKKPYYYLAGAIVVIVVVGAIIYHESDKNAPVAINSGSVQTSVSQSSATSTASSTAVAVPPAAASGNSAYTEALAEYPYRIQFDQCEATVSFPGAIGSLAIRKGDKFMLDNRDPAPHTFKFENQTLTIGGYGYAIVTADLLGQGPVYCDGTNRVSLNVEP